MDEIYDDEIKVVSERKKTYEVDYKPLTLQQVKDLMVVDIEYISTIFGVDVSLCVSIDEKGLIPLYLIYLTERRCCSSSPPYGLE